MSRKVHYNNNKISIITTMSLIVVLLLSACSTGKSVKKGEPQLVASPDRVTLMLAEAADKASDALETLAAVEQARTPASAVAPIENVPPELRRSMTINWIGPIEPITQKLAGRASYSFKVMGKEPPVPIIVSLDVENKMVIDIIRSIGLQLGPRATIKLDANRKAIEIHYKPITSSSAPSSTIERY